MRHLSNNDLRRNHRAGFTLVELLVVIGILLLIIAVTASAVNLTMSGDRVRGAARQVQSYLDGARGRAIYGGKDIDPKYQCGVRFIRDPNFPQLVTSLQYVEINPDNASVSGGVYKIEDDGTGHIRQLTGTSVGTLPPDSALPTHWYERKVQGLLYDGLTIVIGGRKYQISTSMLDASNEILLLNADYPNATTAGPAYQILLPPQPMANQDSRALGNNVVLDLGLSRRLDYYTFTYNAASTTLPIDIMFTPRGTVSGPLSGTGIVEFVVSDRQDSLLNAPVSSSFWKANYSYSQYNAVVPTSGRNGFIYQLTSAGGTSGSSEPAWPTTVGATVSDSGLTWTCLQSTDNCTNASRQRLIVELTPQTGMTAVHPVYVSQVNEDGDPFRYAETGEVAQQ